MSDKKAGLVVGISAEGEAKEPVPVEEANVPNRNSHYEEEEKFYRQIRANEQLDALAISVMGLVETGHTAIIKELAAKHLEKRFK